MQDVLFHRIGFYVVVSSPEGDTYWFTREVPPSKHTIHEDQLYISDGVNTIEGGSGFFSIRYYLEDFSCNLLISNRTDSWKAGDGIDTISEKKRFYEFRAVSSPWADVYGHMTIEGEKINVTGQCFGEKSLTVCPIQKTTQLQQVLRVFSPNSVPDSEQWCLTLLTVHAHQSFDKVSYRLMLSKGREPVFLTSDYTVEPQQFVKEEEYPIAFPRKIRLNAEDRGFTLRGIYTCRNLFHYLDVFDEIPPVIRSLVLLFFERPVFFRFRGEFSGEITFPDGHTEELLLYGPYHYIVTR